MTQEQWLAVMGSNPSKFQGQGLPVERVSWEDAQLFIDQMNAKEGGNLYRLPTEAEWEYAARAGTDTNRYWGDGAEEMGQYAWFGGNSDQRTHSVGQLRPNGWGLCDMLGNVEELCQDWHGVDYYAVSPVRDPQGPTAPRDFPLRVIRGASWFDRPANVRLADRGSVEPTERIENVGLRLVREIR